MKIACVGKGGSGKTTISGLLSRYLASAGFPVIAIDADINQHLGKTLGMSEIAASSLAPMGLEIDRIKNYLRGTNTLIPDNSSMIKTTPPGPGSRLLRVREENPIYEYFSHMADGVRVMAVGPFSEEDLGVRCYHSKTGSVELLLNHLIDGINEYVIVDMTAGADTFASGLFTRFDVTFLVVEPTLKSISVYAQYKKYAEGHGVTLRVIGNKIADESDRNFLQQHAGDDLVAVLSLSPFVKKADRGENLEISALESGNIEALKKIISVVDSQKKDWPKFYRQAVEFHRKNAESWANASTGKDLTSQIDPRFVLRPELV